LKAMTPELGFVESVFSNQYSEEELRKNLDTLMNIENMAVEANLRQGEQTIAKAEDEWGNISDESSELAFIFPAHLEVEPVREDKTTDEEYAVLVAEKKAEVQRARSMLRGVTTLQRKILVSKTKLGISTLGFSKMLLEW